MMKDLKPSNMENLQAVVKVRRQGLSPLLWFEPPAVNENMVLSMLRSVFMHKMCQIPHPLDAVA